MDLDIEAIKDEIIDRTKSIQWNEERILHLQQINAKNLFFKAALEKLLEEKTNNSSSSFEKESRLKP